MDGQGETHRDLVNKSATMEYALIGRPLGHSFSAAFFNEKFSREGIKAHYEPVCLQSIDELPDFLKSNPGLRGFNVTIPYKTEVIKWLDDISEEARDIGAVNVVKVTPDSTPSPVTGLPLRLTGHNTDWEGFLDSAAPFAGDCRQALVCGSGGASKAVAYALCRMGMDVDIVSRSTEKGNLTYGQVDSQVIADHRIIVNCTPLGTWPDTGSAPPLPYHLISGSHLCLDLVYNPSVTAFMQRCAERGATVKNGLAMLHLQALLAWNIWQH